MTVGEVGAVISLPKCVDQTIHADTSHIYTPVQLPGHYFNLFLPSSSVNRSNKVNSSSHDAVYTENLDSQFKLDKTMELGQTAFILKSHILENSAKIMVDEGGQEMLESLLIRPHLETGDALIFDCRILHFGLANQARPTHTELPTSALHHGNADATASISRGEINDDEYIQEFTSNWRVMLYINHHQPWFHDPKNWNEREKLFI